MWSVNVSNSWMQICVTAMVYPTAQKRIVCNFYSLGGPKLQSTLTQGAKERRRDYVDLRSDLQGALHLIELSILDCRKSKEGDVKHK